MATQSPSETQEANTKTTLSTNVWEKLNPEPQIKWSIIANASSYKKGNKTCDLCLIEKMHIADNFNNPSYLNKRISPQMQTQN